MLHKFAIIVLTLFLLAACATNKVSSPTNQQFLQGRMNFKKQHYELAFKQLLPAAQARNAEAQYAIGYMYYYGLGTKTDKVKALAWLHKALENGSQKANKALKLITSNMQ